MRATGYPKRSTRPGVIQLAALLLLSAAPAGADFPLPQERILVGTDEIPDEVLRETIGVLNVVIPGTLGSGTGTPEPPTNPAFLWNGNQRFNPKAGLLKTFRRQDGRFVESIAIALDQTAPVSAALGIGYDSERPLLLRFPIVAIEGSFRRIVSHAPRDLRTWIKLDNPSRRLVLEAGDAIALNEQLLTEAHAPQEPAGAFDIFYLTTDEKRRLYQAPEESASFVVITPASRTYQGDTLLPGRYHRSLFVGRIQGGFAELWVERGAAGAAGQLGWIKIREGGYRSFSDYFPEGSPMQPAITIDAAFGRGEDSSPPRYRLPDEQAVDEQAGPLSGMGELFLTRIRGRFGLVCGLSYHNDGTDEGEICDQGPCGTSCLFLRPVAWIELRDRQGRLKVWPVLDLSNYGGC